MTISSLRLVRLADSLLFLVSSAFNLLASVTYFTNDMMRNCDHVIYVDDNGQVKGFVCTFTDITERKQLEKERLDALTAAEREQVFTIV